MAEAVRPKKEVNLKATDEDIARLQALPLVDDPLPSSPIFASTQEHTRPTSSRGFEAIQSISTAIQDSPPAASPEITTGNTGTESAAVTETIDDEIPLDATTCEVSAPMLLEPAVSPEEFFELQLPDCYTVSELQNFYSNETVDNFSNLEQAFLEETLLDAVSLASFSTENNPTQSQRAAVDAKIPLHEHPLYRLICTHAYDRVAWHRSIRTCRQKQGSVSQQEQAAWTLERLTQQQMGKCRDGCTVGLTYEQTKASLRGDALPDLRTSHEDLRNYLFDEVSSNAFKVAFSRLEVESYLARTLKLCPAFVRFAQSEPIILLSEQNISLTMLTQIQELRSTSSVLFACLHRFSQSSQDEIDEELINDLIGWTFDITGRLVRQCRLEDHLYVAMQLLRLPFSLKYSTRHPALAGLLQPPALDIAWARANSQPAAFIEEPEVELRASLVALCLRTPVWSRTTTTEPARTTQESSTGPPTDQSQPLSSTDDRSSPNHWTLVDSGGESEDEFSATSTSTSSSTHPPGSSRSRRFGSHPTPTTVVENVVCLLDQVGIQDLVSFLFENWSRSAVTGAESYEKRRLLPVFAFANWLLSVLENAKSLSVGNAVDNTASYLRIERQLSKRLTGIVSLLIRGIHSCLTDRLRSGDLSGQSTPRQQRLYPLLTAPEDEKVLLAQYDQLCLRSAELMLFSGSGTQADVEGPCRLVCWRRLSTLIPFQLCSSRSKLRLYQLLLSSVCVKAGDLEADYLAEHYLDRSDGEVDLKALSFDATQSPQDSDPLHEVLALLRSELIQAELGQTGIDAFVLSLGQLASAEFRPPPPTLANAGQNAWSDSKLPTLEHLLVLRIINLLFKLCVVPTLHQKERPSSASGHTAFATVPLSAALGRDQLVTIVSAHTTFAFQHLFYLIVAAASHVDTLAASSTFAKSSTVSQRPDLSSADAGTLLLDLVEALPLRLFKATAEDLGQILCWIGGYSESELVPLHSVRSRLARSLLSHLPWEAVVNTTGEPLIPHKLQNRVAIAIAQSFSRHIIEPSRGAVNSVVHLSKITDAVKSATTLAGSFVTGFIPIAMSARSSRRLQAAPGSQGSSSRRSNSHSPLRLSSSHFSSAALQIPKDPEAASLYHWAISMVLKLRLKPNAGDLTRLLTSAGVPTTFVGQQSNTRVLENPITAFLALEFQTYLPNQTVPRAVTDRSTAELLFLIAEAGHFLLAIEAFSRLCLADYAPDTKTPQSRQSKARPVRLAIAICPAFFQFVSCILEANEASATSVWASLWTAASATVTRNLLPSQSASSVQQSASTTKTSIPGPVVEAFLGAVMNVCLAAGEASASFLRAIVSSILLFTLPKTSSSGWQNNSRANWLLDHILRTAYWLNTAYLDSASTNAPEEWWYSAVGQELRPSLLTRSEVGVQAMPTEEPSDVTESLNPVNESSNWGFYRILSSSWADGLSSLIPANELSRLVWGSHRGGGGDDAADGVNSTLICSLVASAAKSEASDGEASSSSSGCFWLITYLIGADNNPEDRFGGFTIWNDIMHTVTWNRSQLLGQLPAQTEPPATEPTELGSEEKALIDVLTNGGLLSADAAPAAVRENLLRLTRRLPLIQAVSALSICPLEHPAFFLLLHLCLSQCLRFPRTSTPPKCGEGAQVDSEECFPPGFLLLKLLRWTSCISLDSQESQSGHSQPAMTLCAFDALVGRLRDALQYWLKRDSQDDSEDPYGLRSSAAVSFFRDTISLLSDLNQTVLHRQHDVGGALAIRTRIEQFDPSGGLKAVNVDSILSSMYIEIANWNSAKLSETHQPTLTLTSKGGTQLPHGVTFSKVKVSDVSLREFNDRLLIGQDSVEVDRLQLAVQKCVSKLQRVAAASIERNRRLENLQKVLRENILPRLYHDIRVQRSEVVNCKSYLPASFPGAKPCTGGARISVEYQTAELEEPIEKERQTNQQDTTALIGDVLSDSSILAAVSAETDVPSSLAISTSFLARKPVDNIHWVLNGFQLLTLLRRCVEIRQTLHSQPKQRQNVTGHLLTIFNQLCQDLSGSVFTFPPSRAILSKSVDLLACDLFSSGECQFDILLDALTRSPHLTQLLTLRISPPLPQLRSFDLSTPSVNILTSIFRRLPFIYAQCGPQGTLDLLSQVQFESAASSVGQAGCTVSASDLNKLIKDAVDCLVEIRRTDHSSVKTPESSDNAGTDVCDANESLLQLLRTYVSTYVCANFPSSVIHLLESSTMSDSEHLHTEIWPLVHSALCSDIESNGECSLPVNEVISLLKQVNHCGHSTASLILGSQHSSHSGLRGQILRLTIDCVGLLTEQLSTKVCRAVDGTHMRTSEGLRLLHESIFSGLWTWVLRVEGGKTFPVILPSPAENQSSQAETTEIPLISVCIQHLSSTLASVRRSCPSAEHLPITDALADALIFNLFTRKREPTDNFCDLTVLTEEAEKKAEALHCPGFPWALWHPSSHTIQLLNDAVRDVLGCSSQRPTGALTASDARASALLNGAARLLSAALVHEKPDPLVTFPSPSVIPTPEFPNGLLMLAVALVALFDRLSRPSSFSKESAKVSTTCQCASDLHNLLAALRQCFNTYQISLTTLKTAFHDVKSLLPADGILQPEGTVVFELFSLLSVASSMQPAVKQSSRPGDDIHASCRTPYPSLPTDASSATPASAPNDVFERRLAYIAFMVELLLLTPTDPTTTPASGCVDAAPSSSASSATSVAAAAAGDAGSTTTTTSVLSRAVVLLGNLVKPAGSAAGYLVSSLSATPLWQRISSGFHGDASSGEDGANRFAGAFSCRVCGIFSELENSCLRTSWEPVESDGFSEAVQLCEALLRIRTEGGRLLASERNTCVSTLFDALLICWFSRTSTLPASSSALPVGSLPIRTPASVICRPLLCALFFQLPDAFKSSTNAPGAAVTNTVPAPSAISTSDTPRPVATVVDLIDACIWCALQSNTGESSDAKDTSHRIRLLSALFVLPAPGGAKTNTEKPRQRLFVRLHDCVAWLVPACLVCRKLLPLCLYALARDARISDALASLGAADRLRVDSPAILVADILHWLSSTRLRSSDFDSVSGAESSQLTALLLLIYLVIQQISRIKTTSSGRVDAPRNLVMRLIEWLNGLTKGWCQEPPPAAAASSISKEAEFVDRFNQMTECLTAVLEEWCPPAVLPAGSEERFGLERLRSPLGNSTPTGTGPVPSTIARALLARLEGAASETTSSSSTGLSTADVFQAYDFVCRQFWSPLPDFALTLLSATSNHEA